MLRRLIVACCALVLATPVAAKKLYKYQDAQGHWHFSDKAPKTEQKVEVQQLKTETKQKVWLKQNGREDNLNYYLKNDYFGPVEVEIHFSEAENTGSWPPLPQRFVVHPGESQFLFQVRPVNPSLVWHYRLDYTYVPGDPSVQHNPNVLYQLPFAAGKKFFISQAFNGQFSHTDTQNYYAVDILMPEGTPVHAARAGVVMDVQNDFYESGTEKVYLAKANNIRILHEDGSMGLYAHLQVDAALAYPGLKVQAGQQIGFSGNTGFSSGPHLHFAVQVNKGMSLQSVPFSFTSPTGRLFIPIANTWLVNI